LGFLEYDLTGQDIHDYLEAIQDEVKEIKKVFASDIG